MIVSLIAGAALATFTGHPFAPNLLAVLAIERLIQIGIEAAAGASSVERWFDVTLFALFVFGSVYLYFRRVRLRTLEESLPLNKAMRRR